MAPDLTKMEVVLTVKELFHFAPLTLQLSDFLLQLSNESLSPLLCCVLPPLDCLHQLILASLHGTEQGGKDFHAL